MGINRISIGIKYLPNIDKCWQTIEKKQTFFQKGMSKFWKCSAEKGISGIWGYQTIWNKHLEYWIFHYTEYYWLVYPIDTHIDTLLMPYWYPIEALLISYRLPGMDNATSPHGWTFAGIANWIYTDPDSCVKRYPDSNGNENTVDLYSNINHIYIYI